MVMRDAYQKLHFVTPAALVAPLLVALAIFVQMGLVENTGETFLALLFMVIAGPFLSHATIRAIRVRETGDWRLRAGSGEGGRAAGGEKEQ
jgi:multisubunit Na+/H+ antiporter MnhG subunit